MPLTANEASASLVPIDERAESRLQIPDPKREVCGLWDEKNQGSKKKVKNLLRDFFACREFSDSAFPDFCAAKEIPNRADHIPQPLRAGKAEIWGSC